MSGCHGCVCENISFSGTHRHVPTFTKCVPTGRLQFAGIQNGFTSQKTVILVEYYTQDISERIDNRSFERVEQLKYLGITLKNQNSIQEERSQRMLVTTRSRISCLPVCYPKI